MMARHVVLACLGSVATATAAPRVGYVDEIAVFGGVEESHVRTLVEATMTRSGLRARFAEAATQPCGNDSRCLMDRTHAVGAAVGLRFTVAEVAGSLVAAVWIVDVEHRDTRRELLEGIDLVRPDARLLDALGVRDDAGRRPRYAAWTLAVGAGALAIGGAVAMWQARDLRSEFFADHVAANGDVIGISPTDARAVEQRARRWSLAGGILLIGAAASGVGATVLFMTDRGGGVAVTGSL